MSMNNEILVKINNLNFSYNREPALLDINFNIERGDFVGIIGPNGSGKTTLLKIMLGLLSPHGGSVFLFGKKISDFNEWEKIGYVPQKISSLEIKFPITVYEFVSMGRINKSKFFFKFNKKDKEAIDEALEVVEMEKHKNHLISELSGGEQQRVFIARAIASKPEFLILDEPTVGVDIETQDRFYKLLTRLNRDFNLTLAIVSHDVDVIASEVKTLVCLNRSLVYHGTPKEFIKEDYIERLYGKDVRFILHGH